MKNTAAGWGAARNYRVFIWERFAGMDGTRGLAAGTWGDLRGLMQIADLKSRNMAATRLGRRRAAEPVRRTMFYAPTQSCWPCGGDSGAHWKRDKVRIPGVMFHVKQTSKITAAARPIPPPACHSDAPTRSCCQRRIFALESSSRSSSRKTVLMTNPSE